MKIKKEFDTDSWRTVFHHKHLLYMEEVNMEMDFLDDIGEGAYHSDAENRKVKEEMPEERWEKEFDQMDVEEEVM